MRRCMLIAELVIPAERRIEVGTVGVLVTVGMLTAAAAGSVAVVLLLLLFFFVFVVVVGTTRVHLNLLCSRTERWKTSKRTVEVISGSVVHWRGR